MIELVRISILIYQLVMILIVFPFVDEFVLQRWLLPDVTPLITHCLQPSLVIIADVSEAERVAWVRLVLRSINGIISLLKDLDEVRGGPRRRRGIVGVSVKTWRAFEILDWNHFLYLVWIIRSERGLFVHDLNLAEFLARIADSGHVGREDVTESVVGWVSLFGVNRRVVVSHHSLRILNYGSDGLLGESVLCTVFNGRVRHLVRRLACFFIRRSLVPGEALIVGAGHFHLHIGGVGWVKRGEERANRRVQ
mmetsp:Transcript_33052/g.50675  ORF Transcript_33052/g.50675 Transcript_33052/m.50675 type:complete len:251 (+) Transcript_33052:2286-3038(+)